MVIVYSSFPGLKNPFSRYLFSYAIGISLLKINASFRKGCKKALQIEVVGLDGLSN